MLVPATVRAADDDKPADGEDCDFADRAGAPRPLILSPLYVSLAGLQAYDGYATLHGVNNGGREANVLVGGLASKPAAFWAVKAASTGLTIVLAEQLWRTHHRGEAIVDDGGGQRPDGVCRRAQRQHPARVAVN